MGPQKSFWAPENLTLGAQGPREFLPNESPVYINLINLQDNFIDFIGKHVPIISYITVDQGLLLFKIYIMWLKTWVKNPIPEKVNILCIYYICSISMMNTDEGSHIYACSLSMKHSGDWLSDVQTINQVHIYSSPHG